MRQNDLDSHWWHNIATCHSRVSIAMDGTKLPLFIICKGQPGRIDSDLHILLPPGMHGCVQKKAWMDDRAMRIWFEKFWKPYVANFNQKSFLLLDDLKCHKQPAVEENLISVNTKLSLVPPGYTALLQPCDVGINKPLKDRLRKCAHEWRKGIFSTHTPGTPLPAPERSDIATWLHNIWQEFPQQIIRNAIRHCGYAFDDGIDYSYDTQSEDEEDIPDSV